MKVKTEQFTAMKGHVAENCTIIAPSGKEFTLKNTLREALFAAQAVLAANYPAVYESNIE